MILKKTTVKVAFTPISHKGLWVRTYINIYASGHITLKNEPVPTLKGGTMKLRSKVSPLTKVEQGVIRFMETLEQFAGKLR